MHLAQMKNTKRIKATKMKICTFMPAERGRTGKIIGMRVEETRMEHEEV